MQERVFAPKLFDLRVAFADFGDQLSLAKVLHEHPINKQAACRSLASKLSILQDPPRVHTTPAAARP